MAIENHRVWVKEALQSSQMRCSLLENIKRVCKKYFGRSSVKIEDPRQAFKEAMVKEYFKHEGDPVANTFFARKGKTVDEDYFLRNLSIGLTENKVKGYERDRLVHEIGQMIRDEKIREEKSETWTVNVLYEHDDEEREKIARDWPDPRPSAFTEGLNALIHEESLIVEDLLKEAFSAFEETTVVAAS